jgi:hypothetical protein
VVIGDSLTYVGKDGNYEVYEQASGSAAKFDGTDDYIRYDAPLLTPIKNSFTLSINVKQDDFVGTQEYISEYGGSSTGNEFYVGTSGTTLRVGDSWTAAVDIAEYMEAGKEHNISIVSTADNAFVYIDGVQVAEKGSALDISGNNTNFTIGRQGDLNETEYLDGEISDIQIYNRPLDEQELAFVNSGEAITTDIILVAHYAFDDPNNLGFDSSLQHHADEHGVSYTEIVTTLRVHDQLTTPQDDQTLMYGEVDQTAYLSDLTPMEVNNVHGGLQEDTVSWQNNVVIDGITYEKALGMYAPNEGVASVTYDIPEGTTTFSSILAMAEQNGESFGDDAKVQFRILLDGEVYYESNDITCNSDHFPVELNVEGHEKLTLEVDSLGTHWADHSTWVNPMFTTESNETNITYVDMPQEGIYSTGEVLTFDVHYDKAVFIEGKPYIEVEIGGQIQKAYYTKGDGTDTVTFAYEIDQAVDTSSVKLANINVQNDDQNMVMSSPITFGTMMGMRGEYFGMDEQLVNIDQFRSFVATTDPKATFDPTSLDYGEYTAYTYGKSDYTYSVSQNNNLQHFLNHDAASLSENPDNNTDGGVHLAGQVYFEAGEYQFRVRADDGFDIQIDGKQVASYDANQGPTTREFEPFVIEESGYYDADMIWWDQGGAYQFRVEVSNDGGETYHVLNAPDVADSDLRADGVTEPELGTITVEASQALEVENTVLTFDGVDDHVVMADPFINNENFTIDVVINPTAMNDGVYHSIIGHQDPEKNIQVEGGRAPGLWITPDGSGLHWWMNDGTTLDFARDRLNNFFDGANEEVRITWVKEGETQSFYKNGELVWSGAAPATFVSHDVYHLGYNDNNFEGSMNDVRIYNDALSAQDVASGDVVDGVSVHYDFEGNTLEEALQDKSGNNHNATARGGMDDGNVVTTIVTADIVGDQGDDKIDALDGQSVSAGAGDDVITIGSHTFDYIRGGSGNDTLQLSSAFSGDIDLSNVQSVETVDVSGAGNNTITLTADMLPTLTGPSNTLTINGDTGDALNFLLGDNWESMSADGYTTYTDGEYIVNVQETLTTTTVVDTDPTFSQTHVGVAGDDGSIGDFNALGAKTFTIQNTENLNGTLYTANGVALRAGVMITADEVAGLTFKTSLPNGVSGSGSFSVTATDGNGDQVTSNVTVGIASDSARDGFEVISLTDAQAYDVDVGQYDYFRVEPRTVNGEVYENAILLHPSSANDGKGSVTFKVPEGAKNFTSTLGLSDGAEASNGVSYSVLVDGKLAYKSSVLTTESDLVDIDIDLNGAKEITLVTNDNGSSWDWANWLNPQFNDSDGLMQPDTTVGTSSEHDVYFATDSYTKASELENIEIVELSSDAQARTFNVSKDDLSRGETLTVNGGSEDKVVLSETYELSGKDGNYDVYTQTEQVMKFDGDDGLAVNVGDLPNSMTFSIDFSAGVQGTYGGPLMNYEAGDGQSQNNIFVFMPTIREENGTLEIWAYSVKDGVRNDFLINVDKDFRNDGEEHNLVVTFENGVGKAYLDGEYLGSDDYAYSDFNSLPHHSDVVIGHAEGYRFNGVEGNYWEKSYTGTIGDIKMFDRAVDQEEAQMLMKSEIVTDGLIAHLDFENDNGGPLVDKTGNGHDATVVGNPTVAEVEHSIVKVHDQVEVVSYQDTPTVLVREDFENGAQGWTSNITTDLGGELGTFLGRFGGTDGQEGVSKVYNFGKAMAGQVVDIEFDFYELDSWDGSNDHNTANEGGIVEAFQVFVNGSQISSDIIGIDGYAGETVDDGGRNVGDISNNNNGGLTGYSDEIHHYSFKAVVDENGQVKLGFGSTTHEETSNESFGIDNIKISQSHDANVTLVEVPEERVYSEGEALTFTVHYDQEVFVSGSPSIKLNIGGKLVDATYAEGSGSDSLTFTYNVHDEVDTNGITFKDVHIQTDETNHLGGADSDLRTDGTDASLPIMTAVTVETDVADDGAYVLLSDMNLEGNLFKADGSTVAVGEVLSQADVDGLTYKTTVAYGESATPSYSLKTLESGEVNEVSISVNATTPRYGAAQFDQSSNNYIAVDTPEIGNGEFAISTWIKTDKGGNIFSFQVGDNDNPANGSFEWRALPNGQMQMRGNTNDGQLADSQHDNERNGESVNDGAWHHVVLVKENNDDGTSNLVVYRDGVEDHRADNINFPTLDATKAFIGEYMGREVRGTDYEGTDTGYFPFDGQMDDLQLYDRAISHEEVTNIMRGDTTDGLFAHYEFDDATNLGADSTGNFDGTVVNVEQVVSADNAVFLMDEASEITHINAKDYVGEAINLDYGDEAKTLTVGAKDISGTLTVDGGSEDKVIIGDSLTLSGKEGEYSVYEGTQVFEETRNVMSFHGDDNVGIETTGSLGTEFTLTTWFKADDLAANSSQYIMSYDNKPNGGTTAYMNISDGKFHAGTWDTRGQQVVGGNITEGEWNHVTLTVAGGVAKFYVNGEFVGEMTDFDPTAYNADGITLGMYDGRGGDNHLDGSLYDSQVYTKALSETEIRDVMNGQITDHGALKLHVGLNEADEIVDMSTQGNTIVNSSTTITADTQTFEKTVTLKVHEGIETTNYVESTDASSFIGHTTYLETDVDRLPVIDEFTVTATVELHEHDNWDVIFEKVRPDGTNDFMLGFVEGYLQVELNDDDVWEGGSDPQEFLIAPASDFIGETHEFSYSYKDGIINVYADGKLLKTIEDVGGVSSSQDGKIMIGADIDNAYPEPTSDFFDGDIREVKLYNKALAPSEQADEFLQLHYDLESVNPYEDKSGHGRDGVKHGDESAEYGANVTYTEVPEAGTYNTGDILTFSVHYDKEVFVEGKPYIELDVGGEVKRAYYEEGSGTDSVTFNLTLDQTTDLDGIALSSFDIQTNSKHFITDTPDYQTQGLVLDGSYETVQSAEGEMIVPAGQQSITYSTWFFAETGNNTGSGWNSMLYGNGADGGHGIQVVMDEDNSSGNNIQGYMNIGGSWHNVVSGDAELNQWNHVSVVFDAQKDTVTTYINGEVTNVRTGETGDFSGLGQLSVGSHDSASQFFNGQLDDVQVYSSALTANEISMVMDGEVPKSVEDTLAVRYDFEGTTLSEALTDKSGNGHDGTPYGNISDDSLTAHEMGNLVDSDLRGDGMTDPISGEISVEATSVEVETQEVDHSSHINAVDMDTTHFDLNDLEENATMTVSAKDLQLGKTMTIDGSSEDRVIIGDSLTYQGKDGEYEVYSQTSSAMRFDENDAIKDKTEDTKLNGAFTASTWVKTGDASSDFVDFGKDGTTYSIVGTRDGEYIFGTYGAGGWHILSSGVKVNPDEYVNVVGVSDGTRMKIYVDGELAASGTGVALNDSYGIALGSHYQSGGGFTGDLADVQLYDQALNADDIKAIAQGGTADNSLIAHYDFEGTEAGVLLDRSGNDNHLSETIGDPTTVDGPAQTVKVHEDVQTKQDDPSLTFIDNEQKAVFDGKSNMYIADNQALDVTADQDLTIGTWVNLSAYTDDGGVYTKFINKGMSSAFDPDSSGYSLRIMDLPSHNINGEAVLCMNVHDVHGNSAIAKVPVSMLPLGEDHHIAGVLDRANNQVKLLIDGEVVATQDATEIGSLDTNGPFALGALDRTGFSATTEYLEGSMDDVQVYHKALSEDEIATMVSGGVADADALTAHYDFDGNEPFVDKSGNGFDLENKNVVFEAEVGANVTYVDTPEAGIYEAGEELTFTVHYDKAVFVEGEPFIELDVGGEVKRAYYQEGSGSDSVTFSFTADATTDLDGVALNSVEVQTDDQSYISDNENYRVLQGLDFDGKDDWLSVANSNDFNFGSDNFTITMDLSFDSLDRNAVLYDKRTEGGDHNDGLVVFVDHHTRTLKLYHNGENVELSSQRIGTNDLQQISVSRVGNTIVTTVNGVQQVVAFTAEIISNNADLILGGHAVAHTADMFDGVMHSLSVSRGETELLNYDFVNKTADTMLVDNTGNNHNAIATFTTESAVITNEYGELVDTDLRPDGTDATLPQLGEVIIDEASEVPIDFTDADLVGTMGDDSVEGTSEAEVIDTQDGNDEIIQSGADSIDAGAGDDNIYMTDINFNEIQGGSGDDTLYIEEDLDIDFNDLSSKLHDVEALDLTKADVTLKGISVEDVLDITSEEDERILKITGNENDAVGLKQDEWKKSEETKTDEEGNTYDVYVAETDPTVELQIDQRIAEVDMYDN